MPDKKFPIVVTGRTVTIDLGPECDYIDAIGPAGEALATALALDGATLVVTASAMLMDTPKFWKFLAVDEKMLFTPAGWEYLLAELEVPGSQLEPLVRKATLAPTGDDCQTLTVDLRSAAELAAFRARLAALAPISGDIVALVDALPLGRPASPTAGLTLTALPSVQEDEKILVAETAEVLFLLQADQGDGDLRIRFATVAEPAQRAALLDYWREQTNPATRKGAMRREPPVPLGFSCFLFRCESMTDALGEAAMSELQQQLAASRAALAV